MKSYVTRNGDIIPNPKRRGKCYKVIPTEGGPVRTSQRIYAKDIQPDGKPIDRIPTGEESNNRMVELLVNPQALQPRTTKTLGRGGRRVEAEKGSYRMPRDLRKSGKCRALMSEKQRLQADFEAVKEATARVTSLVKTFSASRVQNFDPEDLDDGNGVVYTGDIITRRKAK